MAHPLGHRSAASDSVVASSGLRHPMEDEAACYPAGAREIHPGSPRPSSRTSPPAEHTTTTTDSRHSPRAARARHGHRHLRQGRVHHHRPATSARRLAGIGPGGALQRTQHAARGHHTVQEAPLHRYLKEMKMSERVAQNKK